MLPLVHSSRAMAVDDGVFDFDTAADEKNAAESRFRRSRISMTLRHLVSIPLLFPARWLLGWCCSWNEALLSGMRYPCCVSGLPVVIAARFFAVFCGLLCREMPSVGRLGVAPVFLSAVSRFFWCACCRLSPPRFPLSLWYWL